MNVEYINPFVDASTRIIRETANLSTKMGKIYIKDNNYKSDNVLVLIGLTGEITGNVVINFGVDQACMIASAMMMGAPVPELDEIAKSAISELCNMILGNTATIFSQKDIRIDITPPTILTGKNMQLSIHKSVIVAIPIEFEDGSKIELDISYIEKR